MSKQSPTEFINNTLIKRIGDITTRHPYLSFALIGAGIEFLGKCLDEECDWHQTGKSTSHIKSAIMKLFPSSYHPHTDIFVSDLRAGMLHALLPGSRIGLTELANLEKPEEARYSHLKKTGDNRLVIVAEIFYEDFKNACNKILAEKFPPESKMLQPIIEVYSISFQSKN